MDSICNSLDVPGNVNQFMHKKAFQVYLPAAIIANSEKSLPVMPIH